VDEHDSLLNGPKPAPPLQPDPILYPRAEPDSSPRENLVDGLGSEEERYGTSWQSAHDLRVGKSREEITELTVVIEKKIDELTDCQRE
jgi:hypothetical protein